jgi:membrane fusion protein (multidrug efflux system)
MMIGRRYAGAAAAVALLLIEPGCGKKGGGGPGGGGGFQMPPTPVETAEVKSGKVENVFSTVGGLEAVEQITVVSEIDGTVERLPFAEGDPIGAGEVIAKMDDVEAAAALSRAEAVRDQQRLSYERVQRIVDANAAAPQDLDDARAALAVAEADVVLARSRLAKTRITAPFAGLIGPRAVSPGAYLRAGDGIAQLAKIAELDAVFSMPERYLSQLRRGAEVEVATTAFPDDPARGKIRVIDPVVDAQTRNVRVIARFGNPGGRLRPGMSADVRVLLSSRDAALTVPAEAVFAEGTEFLVYKVGADGAVARTPVTLGTRLPDVVEVLTGLAAGDVVVAAGQQKLFPGAKVMPAGAGGPGGPGGAPGAGGPGGAAPKGAGEDSSAAAGAAK